MRWISRGRSRIFCGQRPRRRVVGAQHRQPRARVAGRHAGQQVQVVLEDHRVHRLRRDVDHVRARVAQPDQQEQQPLLVEAHAGQLAQLLLVERQRGHDDRRAVVRPRVAGHGVPHLEHPRLQRLEGGEFLLEREVRGEGWLRDHGASHAVGRTSTCRREAVGERQVRLVEPQAATPSASARSWTAR